MAPNFHADIQEAKWFCRKSDSCSTCTIDKFPLFLLAEILKRDKHAGRKFDLTQHPTAMECCPRQTKNLRESLIFVRSPNSVLMALWIIQRLVCDQKTEEELKRVLSEFHLVERLMKMKQHWPAPRSPKATRVCSRWCLLTNRLMRILNSKQRRARIIQKYISRQKLGGSRAVWSCK